MSKALPYFNPAGKKAIPQRQHYPHRGKGLGFSPFPEPQMDWEILREAKRRCSTCAEFGEVLGACRFCLTPAMGCGRYRSGVVSGADEGADEVLVAMMVQG